MPFRASTLVCSLGAFPLVLLLLERHLLLPLVLSGAIYLLTLHFGWHPHSYPDNEGWYFNPLAWQCLFVIGATAGYFANSRQILWPQNPWLWKLAVVITVVVGVINISWIIHGAYNAFPGLLLQELSPFVADKTNLAPLRLLSFFALVVTTVHLVRHNNGLLRCRAAQLIIRCGQHSLQVFCLGILLSVLGRILLTSFHDGILMQLAIDLAGIVLMAGLAGLLTWYNANNPMRSDAAIVGHTNSEAGRWSIAGISPTGDLTTAIARIERHVIARAGGFGRMWGDQNQAAKRLGIHRQLLNSKGQKYCIEVGAPSGNRTADVVNPDNFRRKTPQETQQMHVSVVGTTFAKETP